MVVAYTKSSVEIVSMLSILSISVTMAVATAQGASVTTTGMADIGITLVVPVVVLVIVSVWVMISIGSPGEVISAIDLSVMVIESLDVTWLVVTVTPDSIVLVVTKVFGWSEEATLGSSASKAKSSREGFHLKVCNLKFVTEASKIKQRGLKSNSHILYTKLD